MGQKGVTKSQVAEEIPFDNTTSGLASEDVQGAIDEIASSSVENNFAYFAIWAEENAALGNNQREWSFGNGATGDIGIVLPIDAQLVAVSYNADTAGTNTEIAVVQNSSTQVATTGLQSGEDGFNNLVTPIQFSAGDRVGFQTITAGGASDVRVTGWFRVPITTLLDVGLNDLNDVTITAPANGEVLTYNGSEWVNAAPGGGVTDHGALTGLLDDDHPQYLNETRGDARYYTQTQLDGGQLDNRYYTETEIDAQQLIQDNNISTNAGNIATNAANILTNTTNISELTLNQNDLITLSGVPENSTDLGIFTGITIPDNSNNKQALQSLETGLDTHVADTNNPHNTTFTQVVAADPGTDITTAEAEELTDGSTTQLHFHRELVDETGTDRVDVLNGGDVQLSNYPQTRNDTTSNDEKVLTTDGSGNLVLRRVLPYYDSIKKISNAVDQVGINQTNVLADWLVFNFTIPETGNYDIDWYYVWSLNDTAQDFISQILLDGSPISTYSEHRQEPKDAAGSGVVLLINGGGTIDSGTNQRYKTMGFEAERNLTAGAHTITIQWAGSANNDRAAIYEGSIRIKRVT